MPDSLRSTEPSRQLSANDADVLHLLDSQGNPSPWSANQYRQGLAAGDYGLGIARAGELVAYALFSCVLDEATLLSIGVRLDWRRQGFARSLMIEALRTLQGAGVTRCLLEVRESNTAAIALYRTLGFRVDGVRRGYYPLPQGREDGLLMSVELASATTIS